MGRDFYEFYMGDSFNRDYRERGNINNLSTTDCCSSTSALPSSYTVADGVSSHVENRFEKLEDAVKALSKQMKNVQFSGKDIGAALKKVGKKLNNGRRSLRSELKTLGGNGRYV